MIVFDKEGVYVRSFSLNDLPHSSFPQGFSIGNGGRFWYMGDGTRREGDLTRRLSYVMAGIPGADSAAVRHTIEQPPLRQEPGRILILEQWPSVMRIDRMNRAWIAGDLEYQIEVIPHSGENAFRIRRDFDLIDYDPRYREDFESQWQRYSREPRMWPRLPEKQPAIRNISSGPDSEMWVFMKAWADSPHVQIDVFDGEGVYQRAFLADASLAGIPFSEDHVYRFGRDESGAPLLIRSNYRIQP
jgi:hypothetical protein